MKIINEIDMGDYVILYVSRCCGILRSQIAEHYKVSTSCVKKLDSYIATVEKWKWVSE